MKKKVLIYLVILLTSSLFLSYFRYLPRKEEPDENIEKFLQKNLSVKSFTADSSLYNNKGERIGQTIFKFAEEGWQIAIQLDEKQSTWLKIGDNFYLKNLKDNFWWQATDEQLEKKPEILSRVDFREFIKKTLDKSQKEKISFKYIKKEVCGKKNCFQYQVIEEKLLLPGWEELKHYIWFDEKDFLLQKEEYLTGTGDLSSTYYFDHNKTSLVIPQKTQKIPPEESIFMMPEIIPYSTN